MLLQQPGHLRALGCCMCREMEELTFFDSGPKPDWTKEKSPGYGRLDFLRPGERGDLCRGGLGPVFVCQTCQQVHLAGAHHSTTVAALGHLPSGSAPAHSSLPPPIPCAWVCGVPVAGGGFGGPIRSRLVGDGSLPDEPPVVLAPQRGPPPPGSDPLARTSSWRPGAEGSTPPDRWNGTAGLVSQWANPTAAAAAYSFTWLYEEWQQPGSSGPLVTLHWVAFCTSGSLQLRTRDLHLIHSFLSSHNADCLPSPCLPACRCPLCVSAGPSLPVLPVATLLPFLPPDTHRPAGPVRTSCLAGGAAGTTARGPQARPVGARPAPLAARGRPGAAGTCPRGRG